ncbi:MAG: hypothetical protein RMJ33_05215 [Saprospiraceae bacterium]|nr:hypothetical protein [Saprospiraceae bacterium]MDW8229220.1 hypothetical protein [Saprospiraceae bacterium]
MDAKINYLRNLIYLGQADDEFQASEKAFVRSVGDRLGLPPEVVEKELSATVSTPPPLPTDEVLRFVLLDDLLNLAVVDRQIRREEVEACEKFAVAFGFDAAVIQDILSKIEAHMERGFLDNQTQMLIKQELFRLTNQNFSHEKYR